MVLVAVLVRVVGFTVFGLGVCRGQETPSGCKFLSAGSTSSRATMGLKFQCKRRREQRSNARRRMKSLMLHIVWEFYARPERIRDFERRYAGDGDWAQLFRNSPDYQETLLVRDMKDPSRFLVVDVWKDLASFEGFKSRFKDQYQALDKRCEELTTVESCVGYFEKL
jgi:heme-degrading monooxygenase HmoA